MGKKRKKKKQPQEITLAPSDFVVYTDGGCAHNPGGPGGYGIVIEDQNTGEYIELSGGFRSTTNNRMEIMAVCVALENLPPKSNILLYTDSQYVDNCFNRKYDRKKNRDLWDRADRAVKRKRVDLRWVRGHNGCEGNERCDELATEALNGKDLQKDKQYENMFGAPSPKQSSAKSGKAKIKSSMDCLISVPKELNSTIERLSPTKYAEKYHVNHSCAEDIQDFARTSSPRFRDYMYLKTDGMDPWSYRGQEALLLEIGDPKVYEVVVKNLQSEKEQMTALRWYCRGLPLKHAIRKALVETEISAYCNAR